MTRAARILAILIATLCGVPAFAQAPNTTQPGIGMILSPCAANVPVVGNGASVLTKCYASALPAALGTGISAALGNNVGSTGAPLLFNGAGGTPTSIGLANGTGLPTTGLTGALQAAQEPAHTGDVTNTAGSLALTLATAQPSVHTWALAQTFTVAPVFTDQSGSRAALGLGTAATQNTGTSGANVPLLNGANTWGATQTFPAGSINTNTNLPIGMGACGSLASNTTIFAGPTGCFGTIEAQVQTPVSAPFTLKNLFVVSVQTPGGVQTYVMTVRKNGVGTTVTCTITGVATTCNDTTHTVSFAAGDLISMSITSSATATGSNIVNTMSTAVTTSP